jgi:hypothetical protein
MKISLCLVLSFVLSYEAVKVQGENIEFVCAKTHKASNTCYFNFKVDGAKYTYVDLGCKKSKKKEEVIKKVKEGELALSREWKIACPEAKP